jgi:hypothetical protein
MNKSGVAAKALLCALDIPPERMIVVHDEIDLPLGKIKKNIKEATPVTVALVPLLKNWERANLRVSALV